MSPIPVLLDTNILYKQGQFAMLARLQKRGAIRMYMASLTLDVEIPNTMREVWIKKHQRDLDDMRRAGISVENENRAIDNGVKEMLKPLAMVGRLSVSEQEADEFRVSALDKSDAFVVACAKKYKVKAVVSGDGKAVDPELVKSNHGVFWMSCDEFLTKLTTKNPEAMSVIFNGFELRSSRVGNRIPDSCSSFAGALDSAREHISRGEVFVTGSESSYRSTPDHWRAPRGSRGRQEVG